MLVRAVGALVGAGFRRYAGYRSATFAGALTNTVFGLLRASIVAAAISSAGGTLGGYDEAAGITYAWLTQAIIAPVHVFGWNDLALRVRTGDIAIDLARPVDLQLQFGAADLGRAAAVCLPRALPPLIVGAATFGLSLPASPWAWLGGAGSLLLAVGISFACRFLVNLLAFWLLDTRGAVTLYVVVSNLLCGLYVPVHWFPAPLAAVAAATPFPSMVQAPADLVSGRVTGPSAAWLLTVQVGWLAVTLLAGRAVLALATRRLVVQGG